MRIELLWKYIHYDVDQLAWRYGKTHNSDEENKEISQTSTDESDTNLVRTWACTGVADLRVVLRKYISAKTEDANDALPTDKTQWGFNFNADVTADGHALARLMHWFVVRWIMWQWCLTFAPEQAVAEEHAYNRVKRGINKMLDGSDATMPMKEALVTPDDGWRENVVITYEPSES